MENENNLAREYFAENLRRIAKEKDITQSDIATATGCSSATVSDWFNGKKYPRPNRVQRIADALGVRMSDLTDRKPSLPPNVTPYSTHKLPLIGTIACGAPILAEENISRYIDVVDTIKADFCLECRGESMIGARIHDGDIVCIRMGVEVLNGQIAAVRIDNEATLKRVYVYPDRVVLQAENPAFPPLIYEKEDMNNVEIIGKAVAFISTVR